MTTTTAHCDECRQFNRMAAQYGEDVCGLGHKPRFYPPATIREAFGNEWGWKRKCEDFDDKHKEQNHEPD